MGDENGLFVKIRKLIPLFGFDIFVFQIFFVPLHPQNKKRPRCSAVGSVPGLGPGCRRFESCHLDQSKKMILTASKFLLAVFCFFRNK